MFFVKSVIGTGSATWSTPVRRKGSRSAARGWKRRSSAIPKECVGTRANRRGLSAWVSAGTSRSGKLGLFTRLKDGVGLLAFSTPIGFCFSRAADMMDAPRNPLDTSESAPVLRRPRQARRPDGIGTPDRALSLSMERLWSVNSQPARRVLRYNAPVRNIGIEWNKKREGGSTPAFGRTGAALSLDGNVRRRTDFASASSGVPLSRLGTSAAAAGASAKASLRQPPVATSFVPPASNARCCSAAPAESSSPPAVQALRRAPR